MNKPFKILVIHGPNLNLLGQREPEIYGHVTLDDINNRLKTHARDSNVIIEIVQSNSEGAIIDAIHNAINNSNGIIINPGAYTHYSLAIYDAIVASALPSIEVHLSNIYAREEFRRKSVIAPACIGQITGLGWRGYLYAFQALTEIIREKSQL
jgi:3-dehydroquinate dehydratase II